MRVSFNEMIGLKSNNYSLNNPKVTISCQPLKKADVISVYDKSIDNLRIAFKGVHNEKYVPFEAPKAAPVAPKEVTEVKEDVPETVQSQAPESLPEKKTSEYKPTGLVNSYTLNGIDYDVVGMKGFNSLDEFQAFILSKGMTNRGKGGNDWPNQCHNFSCEYGDIMLGTSKVDINSDSAAAQASKGNDRQFQNVTCGSHDVALQLMRGELEAGRPCVVKIRRPGTTQNHYGLVCGIRKDADRNNLKNTDFLYIDSYDGRIGQLDGKNYRELSQWKNGVHVWKGQDYNFSYRDPGKPDKYRTADEVKAKYNLA